MDVQGHEPFVLRGAERIIKECRPGVILEIEPQFLEERDFTPATIFQFMSSAGYTCWSIGKWGLGPPKVNTAESANWVAIADAGDRTKKLAARLHRRIRRAALTPLIPGLNPAVVTQHNRERF